jgi:DNA-binding transcriptional ArsR family regulator
MPLNEDSEARLADLDGLKALAHPLRVRIIEALSTYGEHTASGLGERLGESSGATSYHLRQLEKHGYVREVEGRGTARERWWERVPGLIHVNPDHDETEAGRAASRIIMREWLHHREAGVRDVLERGREVLSPRWREVTAMQSASVHVTAEQLESLNEEILPLIVRFAEEHRGQRIPGSRPVSLQYFAFPVIDGVEIPSEASLPATDSSASGAPASTDRRKED